MAALVNGGEDISSEMRAASQAVTRWKTATTRSSTSDMMLSRSMNAISISSCVNSGCLHRHTHVWEKRTPALEYPNQKAFIRFANAARLRDASRFSAGARLSDRRSSSRKQRAIW